MDDVIFFGEKKPVLNNFKFLPTWPGDEKYERERLSKLKDQRSSQPSEGQTSGSRPKRKREESPEDQEDDDSAHKQLPILKKNRYFSEQNVQQIREDHSTEATANIETSSNAAETEQLIKRKGYLLQKLFQSRNLPNLEGTPATTTTTVSDANVDIETSSTAKWSKQLRKHSFQDEFIPLFKDDKPVEIVEPPPLPSLQATTDEYRGPYPPSVINNVSSFLARLFDPQSNHNLCESNKNLRMCEILKLKLDMDSKFKDDKRIVRMIERDALQAKEAIKNRMRLIDSKIGNKPNKQIMFSASSENDDDETTDSDRNLQETINLIHESDLVQKPGDDDEDDDDDNDDDDDEDDDDNDDDDDDDDNAESKCAQFAQYGKNKKSLKCVKRLKEVNKILSSNSEKRSKTQRRKTATEETKIERNRGNRARGLGPLDEAKKTLRSLQNECKMIRKKKSLLSGGGIKKDAALKQQIRTLDSEMKFLRKKIKRTRRSIYSTNYNSSSLSLSSSLSEYFNLTDSKAVAKKFSKTNKTQFKRKLTKNSSKQTKNSKSNAKNNKATYKKVKKTRKNF